MKVMMVGGGTGGHIYPALSVARGLSHRFPDVEFVFVGTKRGLEKDIVPKAGYRLEYVTVKPFSRKLGVDTIRSVTAALRGGYDAVSLIRRERPNIVVGTGGYVCGPVLALAWAMRLPTVIHEQNSLPGVTNRLLGRIVNAVCIAYDSSTKYFPKGKAYVTGNPIRPEIVTADKAQAIKALGLDPRKKTLIVVGASQGAKSINSAMVASMSRLTSRKDLQAVYVTGPNNFVCVRDALIDQGLPDVAKGPVGHITVSPYRHDMENLLAAADLAVSRGGAIFLAELAVRGVPAIIVPLATAAENHQEVNAREMERRGAATVLLDRDVDGDTLTSSIFSILDDDVKFEKMKMSAKALGKADATKGIVEVIARVAGWTS